MQENGYGDQDYNVLKLIFFFCFNENELQITTKG